MRHTRDYFLEKMREERRKVGRDGFSIALETGGSESPVACYLAGMRRAESIVKGGTK